VKKRTFITVFIVLHLLFIALQIHKQSMFIKGSYEKQRLELEREQLRLRKQELEQQLAELRNPDTVKQFALNTLEMKPVQRKQIKKLAI